MTRSIIAGAGGSNAAIRSTQPYKINGNGNTENIAYEVDNSKSAVRARIERARPVTDAGVVIASSASSMLLVLIDWPFDAAGQSSPRCLTG